MSRVQPAGVDAARTLPSAPVSAIHVHDTLLHGIRGRDSQRRAIMGEHLNDAEHFPGQMAEGEGERPNR